MAFLIAEKKLETEQSCWYRFVCDTPADILNLPNATDSGKSYTTKKLALKTSLAYCIGTSRIYMLDSTNQWRLLAGITDIELAAMAVKAEDILAYRNEAERFKDITIERAAAALASQKSTKTPPQAPLQKPSNPRVPQKTVRTPQGSTAKAPRMPLQQPRKTTAAAT